MASARDALFLSSKPWYSCFTLVVAMADTDTEEEEEEEEEEGGGRLSSLCAVAENNLTAVPCDASWCRTAGVAE